jgi:CRISPR-associated protein Cas2
VRELAHIIAYDISSPRRRARVARYLVARGVRVQKSVFVSRLTPARARKLRQALERLIDPAVDRLMIEPVAGKGFERPDALIF